MTPVPGQMSRELMQVVPNRGLWRGWVQFLQPISSAAPAMWCCDSNIHMPSAPPQRNWTQSKECRRVPLPHIHLLYERHMVQVAQMLLQTCFHCERRVAMNQHEGSAEYEDARCGLTSCQAPHCRPLQIGICWLHKCLNRQIIVNVSRYLLNAFYQSHVVLIEQPSSFWLHAGSLMSAGSSFPHASSAFSSIPSSFLTLASAHAYVLSLLWWVALPACPELATDAHNSVTYTVSGAWRQSIWQTAHNRKVIIVYLLWANQSTHPIWKKNYKLMHNK